MFTYSVVSMDYQFVMKEKKVTVSRVLFDIDVGNIQLLSTDTMTSVCSRGQMRTLAEMTNYCLYDEIQL